MSPPTNRTLRLSYHGRIIDHLGIQMYQSPVAAVAEVVSNSWDADAENVWIELPRRMDAGAEISIRDDGIGMTFGECEERYLRVGWQRRGNDPNELTAGKQRPILGRKGIGKFAGFGIAQRITVATVSRETGERTVFELDLAKLRADEYVAEGGEIPVGEYKGPSKGRKGRHGTVVTLGGLAMRRRPSRTTFAAAMARRFLLTQRAADFSVFVNGKPLPKREPGGRAQFTFPAEYTKDEAPEGLEAEDGWGVERLPDGPQVRWQILFYRSPINVPELRGISVFAKGKLAQSPFFFNLSGGLGGQHGLEYMSGKVEADYVDSLPDDLIATERQRINWQHEAVAELLEWGQERVQQLLRIWQNRRNEGRIQKIEDRISEFEPRIGKLGPSERQVVRRALVGLVRVPHMEDEDVTHVGNALLTAWEQGRLHDLIQRISEGDTSSEGGLLALLGEAEVLTALNIAEAVRTKILTVGGLKLQIERGELEAAVRDYIAKQPWLISPEWETFQVERSIPTVLREAAQEANLTGEDWNGRVDLTLRGGDQLLVLEFMRPGLHADYDHLDRFERYVRTIRTHVRGSTASPFTRVMGYLIADKLHRNPTILDKLESMRQDQMYAQDWPMLFERAVAQWREFLQALAARAPDDERLQALLDDVT